MKTFYKPRGTAAEYGKIALNIYTGCNHGCTYCYVPQIIKIPREVFHTVVEPRDGIVKAVKEQLVKGYINHRHKAKGDTPAWTERIELKGKLIHLCFTCDPYPANVDTSVTREIIKLIKDSGNNVQILTKGGNRAERDFDLLDNGDWFGITVAGYEQHRKEYEPNAAPMYERMETLNNAKQRGINTWYSCEPVVCLAIVHCSLESTDNVDLFRIGKMNYMDIGISKDEWADFGRKCEKLGELHERNYYIKDSLRKVMGV